MQSHGRVQLPRPTFDQRQQSGARAIRSGCTITHVPAPKAGPCSAEDYASRWDVTCLKPAVRHVGRRRAYIPAAAGRVGRPGADVR
jgi:hypothetical protein